MGSVFARETNTKGQWEWKADNAKTTLHMAEMVAHALDDETELLAGRQILLPEFKLDFKALAKLSALLKLKKPSKAAASKKGSKREQSAKKVKGDDGAAEDRTFENRLQYIWINTRGSPSKKTADPWNTDLDGGGGDWSSAVKLKGDIKMELSHHYDPKKDYDLHSIRSRTKDEETEEEKVERLPKAKELELLSLAPRYTEPDMKGALVIDQEQEDDFKNSKDLLAEK
ncbi:hypothetical protein R1sor_011546 [Riccia sorocarpa]|uniref:Uncharacterized protein n=1 Tax=Riccia sorocarpa TaxID=122646 RepID=A0ABD3I165_9MARC